MEHIPTRVKLFSFILKRTALPFDLAGNQTRDFHTLSESSTNCELIPEGLKSPTADSPHYQLLPTHLTNLKISLAYFNISALIPYLCLHVDKTSALSLQNRCPIYFKITLVSNGTCQRQQPRWSDNNIWLISLVLSDRLSKLLTFPEFSLGIKANVYSPFHSALGLFYNRLIISGHIKCGRRNFTIKTCTQT